MEQAERNEIAYVQRMLHALVIGGKMHTVDDILALPEGERAELIDGEMFMMAAPTWTHQKAAGWMYVKIFNHIMEKRGKCEVSISPFAVFLKNDIWNYVEPDVLVTCNRDKLDEKGCHGAPDWVIEVVSPSSITMDYNRKLEAYRSAGVGEYWILDCMKKTITVYDFGHGKEEAQVYSFDDSVKSGILAELELDFTGLLEYMDA